MTKADEKEPEVVEEPRPTNVIAALSRVMAEIGGIRKLTAQQRRERGMSGGDEQGVKYAYRGIDQLAQAAQPLLGQYGVVIVPNVLSRQTVGITVNEKPWTDTFVEVEWTLYGPDYGTERDRDLPDKITSITEGWGRDNSDKGINKAMTGAFKNLLLRVLCIGDPQDDTDGHTHEADPGTNRNERRDVDPVNDPVKQTFARLRGLAGTQIGEAVKEYASGASRALTEKALADDVEWRNELNLFIDAKERELAEALPGGATPETQPADETQPTTPAEPETQPEVEPEKPKRRSAREIAAERNAEAKDRAGEP